VLSHKIGVRPLLHGKDYARVLEALRTYVSANSAYWKLAQVPNALRFQGWLDPDGKKSWEQNLK
jgi:hypothetical protein